MPRKARFSLPNMPANVMQRGHNREPVFFEEQDCLECLKILKRVADVCHCAIHAYVLRCLTVTSKRLRGQAVFEQHNNVWIAKGRSGEHAVVPLAGRG